MNVCSSMLKCSFKINRRRDLKQKGLFVLGILSQLKCPMR